MQILIEVPSSLPNVLQRTPQKFAQKARMAMAVKLYEMKRFSSGMAANLARVGRVAFLGELYRYSVAVIDLSEDELLTDVANA